MNQIKVLHISDIGNDRAAGTSVIIPQYIAAQEKNSSLKVFFLNCNNTKLNFKAQRAYMLSDNKKNKCIDDIAPDLVIFHELYKPVYINIYKYLKRKKIPYIIIPHGGLTKKAQNTKMLKKRIGNIFFFKAFLNSAVAIQYLSLNEQNNSFFPKYTSYVLGNGIENIPEINLYQQNKDIKNKMGLVYIGRYDCIIKGLDQLLAAMKKIKNNGIQNVTLSLYGKGDEYNEKLLKDYIDKNQLNDIVILNGPIYDDDKRKVMIQHDVFIQVSRTEGQPLGVMEAMCLGMPLLVSDGTGFANIVKEYKMGYAVMSDTDDIYKKILKYTKNKSKLTLFSQNAFNYAKKNYLWSNIVDQSVKIYNDLIRKNRGD